VLQAAEQKNSLSKNETAAKRFRPCRRMKNSSFRT